MRKFSFKLRMLFWNFSRTWLVLKCNFWEWKKDQNQTLKISINHMLLLVSHTWLVFYHESSSSSPQYLSLISRFPLCISAHAPFFICTRIKKIFQNFFLMLGLCEMTQKTIICSKTMLTWSRYSFLIILFGSKMFLQIVNESINKYFSTIKSLLMLCGIAQWITFYYENKNLTIKCGKHYMYF